MKLHLLVLGFAAALIAVGVTLILLSPRCTRREGRRVLETDIIVVGNIVVPIMQYRTIQVCTAWESPR